MLKKMLKKTLKGFAFFVVIAIVIGAGWMMLNWKDIKNIAEVNSAWYAQNSCSCLFVTKRSEQACRDYTRQILPFKSITIDHKNKSVTAVATALTLWNTNTSRYEGARHGCRLVTKHRSKR